MFWDVFSSLCVENGVSPNTVAAAIGCKSTGTVTGWKNGAIPRNSVKLKLANYFGVEASIFNEDTEQKEKPEVQMDNELDAKLDSRLLNIKLALKVMPEKEWNQYLDMFEKMVK